MNPSFPNDPLNESVFFLVFNCQLTPFPKGQEKTFRLLHIFKSTSDKANNMDPDQTAPKGAV